MRTAPGRLIAGQQTRVHDDGMVVYRRPGNATPLTEVPQLASWDRGGHPSQVRLTRFLDEVATVAAPFTSSDSAMLAFDLVIGAQQSSLLDSGGRDLDNYLFPVAQRLGAHRFVAVFGRKVHGPSTLAVSVAEPVPATTEPQFIARLVGSYDKAAWKHALRDRLLENGVTPVPGGPLAVDIAITVAPKRNWANVWKPLIDSLGPILGEDPSRSFHPYDDRITCLSLFQRVDASLGHDVGLALWWAPADATAAPLSQR